MKIACQSCQAKYTIADEKVVGKVVKIRCKKCGSTIVVNGQEGEAHGGAAAEEPTEVRSSSADFNGAAAGESEAWTVNVGDDDQRTLTTHQVVAEFAKGVVTDETFCWRDGMGDWLPLREIEELASACGLTAASAFARQSAQSSPAVVPQTAAASFGNGSTAKSASVRPAGGASSGGSSGGALAGIFGGGAAAASPAAASGAGAARRSTGRSGGADLFGSAAEAGGENDVMTSAPQNASAAHAPVDDGKMTGQRNENSVLFSLNALTANEPKKPGAGSGSSSGLTGAAEGDGSGLIDIRALSSSMGSTGPKKTNHADDIMNLGGGGAFSAALAAPVLTAPPLDSDVGAQGAAAGNKKMMMMFGGLALLLIVGMVVMFFLLQPKTPPVAANTADGTGSTAPTGSTTGAAAATTPPPAATTAPTAVAAADTAAAAGGNEPKAVAPTVGNPGSAAKSRPGGGSHTSSGGDPGPAPTPPPPPPPSGPGPSLDALMKQSAGGGSGPSNAAPSGGATAPFDRGAAAASLGAIADSVSSCKKPGGPTGEGHVSITFSPNGSVISAIVDQPPYAGTAVGGCVAGKFRGAHVPAFAGGSLAIGKRFTIN